MLVIILSVLLIIFIIYYLFCNNKIEGFDCSEMQDLANENTGKIKSILSRLSKVEDLRSKINKNKKTNNDNRQIMEDNRQKILEMSQKVNDMGSGLVGGNATKENVDKYKQSVEDMY